MDLVLMRSQYIYFWERIFTIDMFATPELFPFFYHILQCLRQRSKKPSTSDFQILYFVDFWSIFGVAFARFGPVRSTGFFSFQGKENRAAAAEREVCLLCLFFGLFDDFGPSSSFSCGRGIFSWAGGIHIYNFPHFLHKFSAIVFLISSVCINLKWEM